MHGATARVLDQPVPARPQMSGRVGPDEGAETPLERVARGEPRAVEACVQAYGPLVAGLARRLLRTDDEVEDAVQDIFVELWKTADRFDPAKASDRGFVAMVTRRRLIDRIRKQKRRPDTVSIPQGMELPTDEHRRTMARSEAAPALQALDVLPEDRRRFVFMSVVQGYSHSEIAASLDVPLGTVKSGIRRGLMAMRDHLDGLAGQEVER